MDIQWSISICHMMILHVMCAKNWFWLAFFRCMYMPCSVYLFTYHLPLCEISIRDMFCALHCSTTDKVSTQLNWCDNAYAWERKREREPASIQQRNRGNSNSTNVKIKIDDEICFSIWYLNRTLRWCDHVYYLKAMHLWATHSLYRGSRSTVIYACVI